ncbi:hypothetical protein J437_LFUL011469 [Ladona fulva]|uniref:Fcf2 pre-rRNA processing C-terminal domain-containing protein n=1 Tax=Ladona fulva TaxID=123851 RepID=A0A8K0KG01_LADFU|nr:hypothetical protein J437_LFUL011469 [Ladona fulva]
MDIVIDTVGEKELINDLSTSDEESSESDFESESDCEVPDNFSVSYKTSYDDEPKKKKSKDDIINFNDTYVNINVGRALSADPAEMERRHKRVLEEILKKSVIRPGIEKLEVLPKYELSRHKLQKLRKEERAKSKGKDWYNLPATEMTEEMKNDLEVLQMRSVLDPKQFYKKNDLKVLPKYFQVGRIVETPADFYNSRVPKKERKNTMVEELLADAEFKRYNKRKYKEIIEEKKKKGHSRAHRIAKKLKKKNK